MLVHMLKSKIHGAITTGADLHYEGSIMIDKTIMDLSNILPYEKVSVWNCANGNRFETYAIVGPPHQGDFVVNGAAAHLVNPGDKLIIASFCTMEESDARAHHPTVVIMNENSQAQLKRD